MSDFRVENPGGGGGSATFTGLTDTPADYTGQSLKVVSVNAGETALVFTTLAGGGDALTANPLSQFAATTSLQLKNVISDETGSGALVFATSPTLVTPALGTPASGVATNLTGTAAGLTAGNVTTNANLTGPITSTGNATAIADAALSIAKTNGLQAALDAKQATLNNSAGLLAALSDETGTGVAVFNNTPTLVAPLLGTPTSGVMTNVTGTAAGLTAGNVTTNANLTGVVTSVGNATAIADTVLSIAKTSALQSALDLKAPLDSPAFTTPGAFTTGGTITLAENTSIALDPAGSADGRYTGITVTGTGGAVIAFGDLVCLSQVVSRWELVDVSVAAASVGDARKMLGMAVTTSTDGGAITVLLQGIIRADANFPALTIGNPVYATTLGDVTMTQPSTTDHIIRIIGFSMTADELYFNPSNDYITRT